MSRAMRLAAWALGVIVVAGGVSARVYPVLARGDGNLRHEIHWILHGYDRVWYRDRTYLYQGRDTLWHLRSQYGSLRPTGETVVGLPVLTPGDAAGSTGAPAVLLLQKDEGHGLVYVLNGGP